MDSDQNQPKFNNINNNYSNSMQRNSRNEDSPDSAREIAPPETATIGASQSIGLHSSTKRGTYKIQNQIWSDVNFMKNRRVNFNLRARKQMELICEDKVSRYKLEEVHCSLPSSLKSTFIMTFSPDGLRVASTHGDHRIYICDLNTGKLLDTLEGHPKTPWCLAWHPSNRGILASGCLAGEVRVWDLKSKACETWTSENNSIITSLDFHPKERVLVIATANDILFWDWSESEPFAKSTTMHEREKVKFVVFDSSGTKLITGISNSPRYVGYSNESLQNRIIDGYISHGNNLHTDNMTHNSEITNSPTSGINTNRSYNNDHDISPTTNDRHFNLSTNTTNTGSSSSSSSSSSNNSNSSNNTSTNHNSDHDIYYRNTVTISRVAFLYRQLEALEDSMRNATFSPYMNPRSVDSPELNNTSEESRMGNEQSSRTLNEDQSQTEPNAGNQSHPPPTDLTPSQVRENSYENGRSARTSNTFEPYLVTFDESLEQLQLPPLIINGQVVNIATIIERYPIDTTNQLNYLMQFESINQVNQNFIRISKLMSSARLYRQVVQQIQSSEPSESGHHQPNQILTAQSTSPRSSRNNSNLSIVLRNFSVGDLLESNPNPLRSADNRPTDPIMAIQFRNSVRNVPLVTVCKLDLIAARTVCIIRSQQLIEQALTGLQERPDLINSRRYDEGTSSSSTSGTDASEANGSLCSLLSQIHTSLSAINHAPLTTSNAYAHITSLRILVEKLLTTLCSLLNNPAIGRRLTDLIQNTAFSLTGRRWSMPLGPGFDELRLDVIHTLCIVDLSMHFARQVQFLQMQRVSFLARIEQSRRTNSSQVQRANNIQINNTDASKRSPESEQSSSILAGPSTSTISATVENSKRSSDENLQHDVKRRKINNEEMDQHQPHSDNYLATSESLSASSNDNYRAIEIAPTNVLPDSMPPDRLMIWNNQQNQVEQSLQRFLLATSSMNNSHVLVRIYHRLPSNQALPLHAASIIDHALEQQLPPTQESRRRASFQEHSMVELLEGSSESSNGVSGINGSVASATGGRAATTLARIRQPVRVNLMPTNSSGGSSNGAALDAWQRHPHLHVYQTRGNGQHLWFNQWTIPVPMNNSNYRLQCWNFSISAIPNIKDSQANIITHKCRIHNDSSVDVSSNGSMIACLVPRDDVASCIACYDLKVFSINSNDFGTCYYKLPHGPNAISVSLSPSGNYVVVGLASHKFISHDPNDDDLTIAKVFKLSSCDSSCGFIRDIKIKRDDSSMSLNAIKWMQRGIVYNVGPQHHQRYQAARMRNVVAS